MFQGLVNFYLNKYLVIQFLRLMCLSISIITPIIILPHVKMAMLQQGNYYHSLKNFVQNLIFKV